MNTDYLREFTVLARRLNYTLAANELHVSQPTLSRHIADLEKLFGCTLVDRENGITLTYAGETLLNQAFSLLASEERLKNAMEDAKNHDFVELRIHDWRFSRVTIDLVRAALREATVHTPYYRARFMPPPHGIDIAGAISEGLMDVGILAHTAKGDPVYEESGDIAVIPLPETRTRLHFFVGVNSSLAELPEAHISDLQGHPIVLSLGPETVNIASDMTRLCEAEGFKPTFYSTTLESIDDLFCLDLHEEVHIGIEEYQTRGYADNARLRMIPCADDVYVTMYLLYKRTNPNPVLAAFLEELERIRAGKN